MNKKIWVIDDDPSILDVIQIILEDSGYKTEIISNFEIIKEKIQEDIPDLILLDVWVSGHNGKEIAEFIRNNKKTKNVPIIIVSALPNLRNVTKKIGADDFLEKPFNLEDLLKVVKKHIKD